MKKPVYHSQARDKIATVTVRKTETKTYRLGSDPMFNAPGVIRWAINGASFEKDRAAMVRVVATGWNIPEAAALALLTKQVPFTIEGETVVFTA